MSALSKNRYAKCSYCVLNKKTFSVCPTCQTAMCLRCFARHEKTPCKVIIKHYCIYSFCLYILSSKKEITILIILLIFHCLS